MFKRTTFFILITVALAGSFLFHIKYAVIDLEQKNSTTKRSIQEHQESLHVLKAEWSHLNDPARLKKLAGRYLPHLKPIRGDQTIYSSQVGTSSFSHEKGDVIHAKENKEASKELHLACNHEN